MKTSQSTSTHPVTATSAFPLVSIIIPCYNAELYVAEAIQSALDQTYPNCEVIVIDDGSTDNSLEVIKNFGDRIHWETGPNRGACSARNRGIELSKGKFIKFLDSDDTLVATILEKQVFLAQQLPENVIPYGNALDYYTKETTINSVSLSQYEKTDEQVIALIRGNIMTICPLHRNSILGKDIRFDERLSRGQEWNFHIQLALKGFLFHHHDDFCFYHRRHDGEYRISNTIQETCDWIKRHNITSDYIIQKYGNNFPTKIKIEMYVRFYLAARRAIRHCHYDAAKDFLHKAKQFKVKTRRIGSLYYRALNLVFGPYFAENIVIKTKYIIKSVARPFLSR